MAALSEFLNKSACDVLYLPKVALGEYPPIIVEIQKVVSEKYMARAARYSTLVYEKYSKCPNYYNNWCVYDNYISSQ